MRGKFALFYANDVNISYDIYDFKNSLTDAYLKFLQFKFCFPSFPIKHQEKHCRRVAQVYLFNFMMSKLYRPSLNLMREVMYSDIKFDSVLFFVKLKINIKHVGNWNRLFFTLRLIRTASDCI